MKLNYILILMVFLSSCAVKHDYYKNISDAHYFNALCASYVKDEIVKQTLDPDIGVIILSDLLDSKINLLKAQAVTRGFELRICRNKISQGRRHFRITFSNQRHCKHQNQVG